MSTTSTHTSLLIAFAFTCLFLPTETSLIGELSFEPPFTGVDRDGHREIPNWTTAGDAQVLQHFARLTPDRQSKRGFLWSNPEASLPAEFSIVLKFRLSGQGKVLFGDGLALWLTEYKSFTPGGFHGSVEDFVGIAIVFDTFKNEESGSKHKDVSIYVNDGKKDFAHITANVEGCDAMLRYHEGRGDFSVTNSSRMLLEFRDNSLKVYIDARNTGDFTDCHSIDNLELPEGWHERARIGLSATTGALADNHDVLSLKTYSRTSEAALQRGERGVSDLDALRQALEHQMTSVKDHLGSQLGKVQAQESKSELRIAILEEKLTDLLLNELTSRLETLEGFNVHNLKRAEEHTETRLSKLESAVVVKMEERIRQLEQALANMVEKHVEENKRSWWGPFAIILVCVFLFFGVTYKKFSALRLMRMV
eukprot:TRINITY_DN62325_c0_g1_i1.p1 TRINITY_DN62325_c0_g1~~TRINITY_DN62325_c0_g1_i1.p1  ORF type:complete len:422 (+),score=31.84 TRINITY_DN62325_c0_g1_i1:119-1384(+)